jgi:hypothetical protein
VGGNILEDAMHSSVLQVCKYFVAWMLQLLVKWRSPLLERRLEVPGPLVGRLVRSAAFLHLHHHPSGRATLVAFEVMWMLSTAQLLVQVHFAQNLA